MSGFGFVVGLTVGVYTVSLVKASYSLVVWGFLVVVVASEVTPYAGPEEDTLLQYFFPGFIQLQRASTINFSNRKIRLV